ncbi:GntR family transcriptional regulator [Aestuariivirga litoralis]|uniref:GntR family transcriptional regulator n=1 Tax=Aestuariivirga litoralis TaxID=2650924 RepID=UPI0018C75B68|nr:GntR family transcriptional regulator [Aestuariivirga litoralis]
MIASFSKVPLDRRRSMREQIYDLLRAEIVGGSIKPGATIDEKKIAAQLKISRTPVREAVKKLSDEHLVEVIAQSGTRAAPLDREELRQSYIVRRALEMESAAQAVPHMAQIHADALADILQRHARFIDQRDYAKAIAADDEFHRYIAEISNLPRLWRAIEIQKAPLDRCRHLALPHPGEAEATLDHHRAIIRALNSGNAEQARNAMASHLDKSYSNAVKILDKELEPQAGEN